MTPDSPKMCGEFAAEAAEAACRWIEPMTLDCPMAEPRAIDRLR